MVCLQTKVVYSLVCEPLGWFLKKKPRGAGRGAPTNHARLPQTIGKTLWFVKFQSGQSSIQWFVQTTPRKKVPTKNTQTGNKPLWSFFAVNPWPLVTRFVVAALSVCLSVHPSVYLSPVEKRQNASKRAFCPAPRAPPLRTWECFNSTFLV